MASDVAPTPLQLTSILDSGSTDDLLGYFNTAGKESKTNRERIEKNASIIFRKNRMIRDLVNNIDEKSFPLALAHEQKRGLKAAEQMCSSPELVNLLRDLGQNIDSSTAAQLKINHISTAFSSNTLVVKYMDALMRMREQGSNRLFSELMKIIESHGANFESHLPSEKSLCSIYKKGWNTKAANRYQPYKLFLSWFKEKNESLDRLNFLKNLKKFILIPNVFPENSFRTKEVQRSLAKLGISTEELLQIANNVDSKISEDKKKKNTVKKQDVLTLIDKEVREEETEDNVEVVEGTDYDEDGNDDEELPMIFQGLSPPTMFPMDIDESNVEQSSSFSPDESVEPVSEPPSESYLPELMPSFVQPKVGQAEAETVDGYSLRGLTPPTRKRHQSFGVANPQKRRRTGHSMGGGSQSWGYSSSSATPMYTEPCFGQNSTSSFQDEFQRLQDENEILRSENELLWKLVKQSRRPQNNPFSTRRYPSGASGGFTSQNRRGFEAETSGTYSDWMYGAGTATVFDVNAPRLPPLQLRDGFEMWNRDLPVDDIIPQETVDPDISGQRR